MVSIITLQFYFDFNKLIKKYHNNENAVNWLNFCFLGVSLYLHSDALGYGIIENDMSPPTCHLSSSTIPVLKGEALITGSHDLFPNSVQVIFKCLHLLKS